MNHYKIIGELTNHYTDMKKEEYSEALECVVVAYDVKSQLFKGELLESDLTIGYMAQIDHVISLFSWFTKDNLFNPNASFKDCAEEILAVGLNY